MGEYDLTLYGVSYIMMLAIGITLFLATYLFKFWNAVLVSGLF